MEGQTGNLQYQIVIEYCLRLRGSSHIKTYAGNIETSLGGSFLEGILDGLVLAIKEIVIQDKVEINISRKIVKQNLVLIAAIKGESLVFIGCTREALGMPALRKNIKILVYEKAMQHFKENPAAKASMIGNFEKL